MKVTPYQRKLLIFLSVATFFEGYDFFAITQILPNLREAMALTRRDAGLLIAVINAGAILAYLLVRKADRWGRRRLLVATIVGYTLLTAASGLAPNVWVFALCQMLARVFLLAEWSTSLVIAAEEFPAEQRGSAIGTVCASSALGSIVCAGIVPLLLKTDLGWRAVYLVSVVPLMLAGWARRDLQETRRFKEQVHSPQVRPLGQIMRGPYRPRILKLGLIWFLSYICTQNSITFWKDFALNERGLSDGEVGLAMALAATVSLPVLFVTGKFLDKVGRKRGSVAIFSGTALGVFGGYTAHSYVVLSIMLGIGMIGVSAIVIVLNTFTAELFPTEFRGDAFAWANNLLGRIGYLLSPIAVGYAAEQWGWGSVLRYNAGFALLALGLILWLLPETRGRELEETAAL